MSSTLLPTLHLPWDGLIENLPPWSPYRTVVWQLHDHLSLVDALFSGHRVPESNLKLFSHYQFDRFQHRGENVTSRVLAHLPQEL